MNPTPSQEKSARPICKNFLKKRLITRQRIAALNGLLQGRGGGKDNQAQGSAPLPEDWQQQAQKSWQEALTE